MSLLLWNKTSKQIHPSVGIASLHRLSCQSQPAVPHRALSIYFCPSLSVFLCFFSRLSVSGAWLLRTSAPLAQIPRAPCHQILFSLHPCYIPHTIPLFPLSVPRLPPISLSYPHISYRFMSWGEKWNPHHNWWQCPRLCMCLKLQFHVLLQWGDYPSSLLHSGLTPHRSEHRDELMLTGCWFLWSVAAL